MINNFIDKQHIQISGYMIWWHVNEFLQDRLWIFFCITEIYSDANFFHIDHDCVLVVHTLNNSENVLVICVKLKMGLMCFTRYLHSLIFLHTYFNKLVVMQQLSLVVLTVF